MYLKVQLCRFGGFCNDIDRFDGEMFRLSPAEAIAMDPAQRTLIEQTQEALIDAQANSVLDLAQNTGQAHSHCLSLAKLLE